jgi:hypothetical protein
MKTYDTNMLARVKLGAALADDDIAWDYGLI